MKKMLIPIMALLIMASCVQQNENTVVRTPANEELIKNYMNAYSSGDTTSLDKFLADDFKAHGPALNDSSNKAGFLEQTKKYWREEWQSTEFDRITMLSMTLKDGKVPGDWVLDWGIVTITYKDDTPPTKFQWHGVYKIENGKIAEGISYFDRYDIMRQIGFRFVLPEDSPTETK